VGGVKLSTLATSTTIWPIAAARKKDDDGSGTVGGMIGETVVL
jgi:hypothetical protein